MKQDYRELLLTGTREIFKLERFVEEICEFYNINNEYFGNILLATTEAAGILFSLNGSGERDKIVVNFDKNPKGLIFKIKLGNGIETTGQAEDILDREIRRHKLSKDVFIIKALADEVTIAVNAKSIVLVFYVTSMNYEKSLHRINQLTEYWTKKQNVIHRK